MVKKLKEAEPTLEETMIMTKLVAYTSDEVRRIIAFIHQRWAKLPKHLMTCTLHASVTCIVTSQYIMLHILLQANTSWYIYCYKAIHHVSYIVTRQYIMFHILLQCNTSCYIYCYKPTHDVTYIVTSQHMMLHILLQANMSCYIYCYKPTCHVTYIVTSQHIMLHILLQAIMFLI